MSDDLDGWICLHRELLEKPIWANSSPEQKCILIALLMLANHKPKKWEWKGEKFMVKRGQMVTSLESISVKAGPGISIQNVRTAIARFEKLEFLTNQSTKTGRLITICNYSKYQDKKNQPNKDDNKDLTKTQQSPNKDLTPNNNDNNDNKEEIYVAEEQKPAKPNGKHSNKILFEQITEIYNETLGGTLPRVESLSEPRQRALKARCSKKIGTRETDNPEFWRGYFWYISTKCPFLTGEGKDGWTATFDWLINERNFLKVIEGNYERQENQNASH